MRDLDKNPGPRNRQQRRGKGSWDTYNDTPFNPHLNVIIKPYHDFGALFPVSAISQMPGICDQTCCKFLKIIF